MGTEGSSEITVAAWPRMVLPGDTERIIRFRPAYHRCTDPAGNFGIGSVRMMWISRVGAWAVSWEVSTGWELPDAAFALAAPTCTHPMHQGAAPTHRVMGGAVDFHAPVPRYEGHAISQERCPITEAACYLDCSFLLAEELLDLLRTEGDEAVWLKMEAILHQLTTEETE